MELQPALLARASGRDRSAAAVVAANTTLAQACSSNSPSPSLIPGLASHHSGEAIVPMTALAWPGLHGWKRLEFGHSGHPAPVWWAR